MTWTDHCWEARNKVYRGLWALWNTKASLPLLVRMKLVRSCLIPHFCYGSIVMPVLDSASRNLLQVAINYCLRFVFSVKRNEIVSQYEKTILGCSLFNYRKFEECKFMYRLISTEAPVYLFELLTPASSARTLNYIVPVTRSAIFRRSFFAHAIATWNSTPTQLRRKPTLATFTDSCLEYFSKLLS